MDTVQNRYLANYERIAADDMASDMLPAYYRMAQARKLVSYCGDLRGKRVLDVGAGRGEFLSLIPQAGRVGVDIAPTFLKHLASIGIKAVCADAEDLPFESEFDLVVMTDILEHVLHPNRAVASAWRALRFGGRLLVRVPYREDISVYKPENGCKYEFAHLRSFNEISLQLALKPFVIRRTYYDGFTAYRRRWLLGLPYRLDNDPLISCLTGGKVKGPHLFVSQVICRLPNTIGCLFFKPLEICMVGKKA